MHVLTGRTAAHSAFRYMITNASKHSQPLQEKKPFLDHMKFTHVLLSRGTARPVPRYPVAVTYGKRERRIQKRFFLCFR